MPWSLFYGALLTLTHLMARSAARGTRTRLAGVGAVVLTALLAVLPLDGWPGVLLRLTLGEDTEFAADYSAFGFWSVREGMTTDEVVARIGQPLERVHLDDELWRYSRSPSDTNYRSRSIRVRDGRVVERRAEFYVD